MLFFEVVVRRLLEKNHEILFQIAFPRSKQPDVINDDSIFTNPCLSSGYTQHAPQREERSSKHGYTRYFIFCARPDLHFKGNIYFEIQQ